MTVGRVLAGFLQIYIIVLIARIVLEYVFFFARDWRPTGFVLLLVEGVYTVTDPPLKLLRRFIPPLRIGGVALDLAFVVLFILVQVLIALLVRYF
ncbi:MAG: YggT family protein [Frankiales bacterium]|nr:YggT family protein [Frankiales bacterium]